MQWSGKGGSEVRERRVVARQFDEFLCALIADEGTKLVFDYDQIVTCIVSGLLVLVTLVNFPQQRSLHVLFHRSTVLLNAFISYHKEMRTRIQITDCKFPDRARAVWKIRYLLIKKIICIVLRSSRFIFFRNRDNRAARPKLLLDIRSVPSFTATRERPPPRGAEEARRRELYFFLGATYFRRAFGNRDSSLIAQLRTFPFSRHDDDDDV